MSPAAAEPVWAIEIKGLSEAGIIPLIDPAMIVGEACTWRRDARLPPMRVCCSLILSARWTISIFVEAGLIGQIGDADYEVWHDVSEDSGRSDSWSVVAPQCNCPATVDIPVLNVLNLPGSTWSATDRAIVVDARSKPDCGFACDRNVRSGRTELKVTLAPVLRGGNRTWLIGNQD